MKIIQYFYFSILFICTPVIAADEWSFIGKSANGNSVYSTVAEHMPDGSLRMFLKGEEEREKEPTGFFAFLKKPEKYIETIGPIHLLVHCKKRSVRNFVAGTFGSEFYNPWQPPIPGSYGALAFNAFCKSK